MVEVAGLSEYTNTIEEDGALTGEVRCFIKAGPTRVRHPGIGTTYKGRLTIGDAVGSTKAAPTREYGPSDSRGGQRTVINTQRGQLEEGSFSGSQAAEKELREEWHRIHDRDIPIDVFLPQGHTRDTIDLKSHSSIMIFEDVLVTTDTLGDSFATVEDNANAQARINLDFNHAGRRWIVNEAMPVNREATAVARAINDVTAYWNGDGWEYFAIQAFDTGTTEATLFARNMHGIWVNQIISVLDNDQDADRVYQVGSRLLILSEGANAHVSISIKDAVANKDAFTLIEGYTAAKQPNAIYAPSPGQITVVGNGGYIYSLASVNSIPTIVDQALATTQNLNAIHGKGRQVLAGGVANALVLSEDSGQTWTALTGPSGQSTAEISTLWVLNRDIFIVGYGDGKLFYTIDAGVNWLEKTVPSGITVINDLQFLPNSNLIGWIAAKTATAGILARTYDGGFSWDTDIPYTDKAGYGVDVTAVAPTEENRIIAGGTLTTTDGLLLVTND